jgi:hypothetical protein
MLFGIIPRVCLCVLGKVTITVNLTALDVGNILGRRFNHGQYRNQDQW